MWVIRLIILARELEHQLTMVDHQLTIKNTNRWTFFIDTPLSTAHKWAFVMLAPLSIDLLILLLKWLEDDFNYPKPPLLRCRRGRMYM